MKEIRYILKYGIMALLPVMLVMLSATSCERRPLEDDELPLAALIPVKIDWSKSGIDVASHNGGSGVHRVSLRFYPKDSKQPVFDLYLEGNVTEGQIAVPVGVYSVIVFNESVDDKGYWEGKVNFTDVNSYMDFAANAVPYDVATREQQFPFYQPQTGEKLINEPLNLASWCLDEFRVTEKMVPVSYGQQKASFLSADENDMFYALTHITMRALVRPLIVTAQVKNLVSAQTNYFAMRGLASKVYMASGLTTQTPSTHLFTLNGRQYMQGGKDGTTSKTFLCFGRTLAPESYKLAADVLFVTGELYNPTPPLRFDVTDQVILDYHNRLTIKVDISYELPYVEGGIGVDEWDDEDKVITLE